MEIQRTNGNTYLSFEVHEGIEQLFKKQSKGIRESQSWKGLKFYTVPELLSDSNYMSMLRENGLTDDFGTPLYSTGKFNIAFLRTVGGKGKIKVSNDMPFALVSQGIRNIVRFLKEYYEEYLKDYKVKGVVNFEV